MEHQYHHLNPVFVFLCIQLIYAGDSFFKDFIYLFLERGKGRIERRETSMCGCLLHPTTTEVLACNPHMCPDQEQNLRPFDLQAGTQSTEPHQAIIQGLCWRLFYFSPYFFPFNVSTLISGHLYNINKNFKIQILHRLMQYVKSDISNQ